MDKNSNNAMCPVCYDEFALKNLICKFEICLHEICQDCFGFLKSHSDKCPICGLHYKNTFTKDITKSNEIIEMYTLTDNDYIKINKNKAEILGEYLSLLKNY